MAASRSEVLVLNIGQEQTVGTIRVLAGPRRHRWMRCWARWARSCWPPVLRVSGPNGKEGTISLTAKW